MPLGMLVQLLIERIPFHSYFTPSTTPNKEKINLGYLQVRNTTYYAHLLAKSKCHGDRSYSLTLPFNLGGNCGKIPLSTGPSNMGSDSFPSILVGWSFPS